jgi:Na+-translocating ferredoxin:NAD+ oxidoreductase RNF subunit RnfB
MWGRGRREKKAANAMAAAIANTPTATENQEYKYKNNTKIYMNSLCCQVGTTYCVRFCPAPSASTVTPGGGSFINDINSFCRRRCNEQCQANLVTLHYI